MRPSSLCCEIYFLPFFCFFFFNVLEKVMSVVEGGELAMLFYLL